jgi:L-alanine-DL-glutamate epimerase-like enolase superfamily enzyme
MQMDIQIVSLPLAKPFSITGFTFVDTETVRVTLTDDGHRGCGETVGTYYLGETAESMAAQLDAVRNTVERGLTLDELQELLPPCGARNALDCALWDLQAKRSGRRIWELLGLTPRSLTTVYTLGMDSPERMAASAREAIAYPHLKIKLDADRPIDRLEAIREARPDATLVIDVNQGWTFAELLEYLPHCQRLGISMIEQPLARGGDDELEGFTSPVPLGADESCLHMGEFDSAAKRYDVLNIKLDKCGGLSEGLALVDAARRAEMQLMVGNMVGSSLSMAPSFVIGLHCAFVDIDGPLLLAHDVPNGLVYSDGGQVAPPSAALWG